MPAWNDRTRGRLAGVEKEEEIEKLGRNGHAVYVIVFPSYPSLTDVHEPHRLSEDRQT